MEDKELQALLSKKGKPSLLRVPFYLLTQFKYCDIIIMTRKSH